MLCSFYCWPCDFLRGGKYPVCEVSILARTRVLRILYPEKLCKLYTNCTPAVSDRITRHLVQTTRHLVQTTKHLVQTTKHLEKTTKHLEKITKHLVSRKCPIVSGDLFLDRKGQGTRDLITLFWVRKILHILHRENFMLCISVFV